MIQIRERVHDRQARPVREFVDSLLREGAGDDYIGPAAQIARDIFQRFAVADHADLRDDIAAELLHGEFEGHARAERRLFKQKSGVAAFERGGKARARLLDLFRKIEDSVELFDREVEVVAEIGHRGRGAGWVEGY